MDENEFELAGKFYISIKDDGDGCKSCCFSVGDSLCEKSPHCTPRYRADKRSVIFVEKHP